jgi:hypothetical protein
VSKILKKESMEQYVEKILSSIDMGIDKEAIEQSKKFS